MIFNPVVARSATPSGTGIGTLEVGTLVKGNIQGAPWEWKIVHQGNPDPAMYDANCDGCWLLLENIHSQRVWSSSSNDYKNSGIQAWLNGDFFNMLDAGFRNQVKQVKIPLGSGADGLSCKLFLLSGYELGWTTSDDPYFPRDGAKLSYFSSGADSAANNKRIANYNGIAANWWLRSYHRGGNNDIWGVFSDGDYREWYRGYNQGIRPALILPSTALVDDELNILGVA